MKKILKLLYQPYKYLVVLPVIAVSTIVIGSLIVVVVFIAGPRIAGLLAIIWGRINGYVTPMFLRVSGREHINKKQSYVIVSNHQSVYDIFVLYGWLGVDFKWVMKQELRKVPVLGIACEKLGHIYIDRSQTQKAIASINAAKAKITNGTSVLFFPEGTRGRGGKLIPFKKGAFKLAVDLKLPILPVTIDGTHKIMPTKTYDIFPGRATITIHKPIDMAPYSDNNVKELMQHTKNIIESALKTF